MATEEETDTNAASSASAIMSRKDKRKVTKKEKRKQKRKEVAEKERHEEESQLNDPEEQRRIQLEMEMEKERSEKERREFEERECLFLEELARKKAVEEEEQRRALDEEEKLKELQANHIVDSNESDEWEYVDEGPPEIIWQGNEIIVKKNRVKVKKSARQGITTENPNRPTSNPLPPQSEAFTDYENSSVLTAQQILENVAQQTPNFGTEQDKAHCPFHLKTGACRFGSRCSRVHFYPDKSCTLLLKNMYNGPGLAWEQDEGLEHTDEEVEHSYEEFYEDVHTEFLKFGEIINFKVCRNGSYHLRGNVYVHYKSLDSALLAYQSINGRYFAGKQVSCEFVSVTRWRVAICGDYMKSRLKTCSRGTACNFIHNFRNPGGDYEWADWDKPPPRFWLQKMAALFGYSDEYIMYDGHSDEETVGKHSNTRKSLEGDGERHHRLRSHSKELDDSKIRSREHYAEDNSGRIKKYQQTLISEDNKRRKWDLVHKPDEVKARLRHHEKSKKRDDDEYDSWHRESPDGIETSSDRWVPDNNIHTRKLDKHRSENKDHGSHDLKESSRSRVRSKSKEEGRSKESHVTEGEDAERKLKENGKRKSHPSDNKQENNKAASHDSSSESHDSCFKERRSKSSSKSREGRSRASRLSSERKRKTSSTRIDSGKKKKESGEDYDRRTCTRKKISLVQEE